MDKHTLADTLLGISEEAGADLLDAIACKFHNEGSGLVGNTEVSDVEWLAVLLFVQADGRVPGEWSTTPEPTREHWMRMAGLFLQIVPQVADRIGHRWMRIAEAVRVQEKAVRASARQRIQEAHP